MIASLIATLLLAGTPAAQEECARYSGGEQNLCFSRLTVESDKELNDAYGNLVRLLPESIRLQLRDTQRDWLRYRDAQCTAGGVTDMACSFRITRARTTYLRNRLTECKAGACRDDLVAARSW